MSGNTLEPQELLAKSWPARWKAPEQRLHPEEFRVGHKGPGPMTPVETSWWLGADRSGSSPLPITGPSAS